MPFAYSTVEQVQDTLQVKSSDSARAFWIRTILEGVSQKIDRWCGREFRILEAEQFFTPLYRDYLLLPDLLRIDEVAIDAGADGTYETTLIEGVDYLTEPLNAALAERPITRLKTYNQTLNYFPRVPRGVRITGKWGFWDERVPTLTALTADVTADASVIAVADASRIRRSWTLRLGDEQVYVTDRDLAAQTITVLRAQNATVAAAHEAAATEIERYVYPEAIEVACLLQTVRIFRRSETPLGMVNTPGDIGWRAIYIPKFDTDVMDLLAVYRKHIL